MKMPFRRKDLFVVTRAITIAEAFDLNTAPARQDGVLRNTRSDRAACAPPSSMSVFALPSIQGLNNGLYWESPPMGWRSWNPYGVDVDQQKMERVVAAMVERKRTVNGKPTSLLDLGYLNVGLDGGWEQCASVKYRLRYHDSNGRPIINSKFPSLKDLVEYGHQNGLHMGWYHNVCECPEMQLRKGAEELGVYHGDADAILQAGFDSVKFDGCGQLNNMTLWAQLLNASTRPVMIENCHWGYCDGEDFQSPRRFDRDDSSCPQRKSDGSIHCPFHFFRTSMDINTDSETWIRNLQTAVRFLDRDKPLAGKGCWAYPDMLEVGYLKTFEWNRAHFGAWAIMSAPLVLGLDLLNSPLVDSVWEIISNQEAIQVNQRWAGHPGWLLKSWTPDGARKSNNWPNTPNGGVKYEAPLDAMQAWVKPQPGGAVAILVINADASSAKGLDFAIQLSEIGITDGRTATIRSIWDHTNLGIATGEVKEGLVLRIRSFCSCRNCRCHQIRLCLRHRLRRHPLLYHALLLQQYGHRHPSRHLLRLCHLRHRPIRRCRHHRSYHCPCRSESPRCSRQFDWP